MHNCRVDFDALPWIGPMAGIRFKVCRQGGRQLRLVEFARGFVELDWCLRGHIGYILEGRMELQFAGGSTLYGPGDGVFIPPGDEHKHKGIVLGDVVRVVLVEDAPPD